MAILIDTGGDWVKVGTRVRCLRPWLFTNPVTGKEDSLGREVEAEILRFGPGDARRDGDLSFVGEDASPGDVILGWFDFGNGVRNGYVAQMRGDFVGQWEPIGDPTVPRRRPSRSMLVNRHPDRRGVPTDKIHIGYWAQSGDPDADRYEQQGFPLPWPADFVDDAWDANERARVVSFLKAAPKVEHWRGSSSCRFGCDLNNGSTDQGDNKYVWPEGFAHYVETHNVRPPAEFVEHVLRSV